METLYRKVIIKSEKDLPEDGIYFVHSIKSGLVTEYSYHDNPNVWMCRIDWYLQPIETEEETKHSTSWRDFTMTDVEPKCEECPSKQFYEANTAKIMDKIEQPKQTVDTSEEKLFILDLLRLNNSEVMYSEETVINIIKQVKKYQNQQPEISVTDEDIQNAANDYWKDDVKEKPDLLPFAPSLFAAYNAGATDMRDNKIYISPKES